MSACVAPVAPDFQDPVSSPNVAPWLHDFTPPFGANVSIPIAAALSEDGYRISGLVTDPNVGDVLYARWIVNYPDFQPMATFVVREETLSRASTTVAQAELPLKCVGGWTSTPTPQQLELVVADGKFFNTDTHHPDRVVDGAHAVYANWTVTFPCSSAAASP